MVNGDKSWRSSILQTDFRAKMNDGCFFGIRLLELGLLAMGPQLASCNRISTGLFWGMEGPGSGIGRRSKTSMVSHRSARAISDSVRIFMGDRMEASFALWYCSFPWAIASGTMTAGFFRKAISLTVPAPPRATSALERRMKSAMPSKRAGTGW